MFLGQHHILLDKRKRLSLPEGFAASIDAGAFVTQGFDHNLLVLTHSAFAELYEKFMAMNLADPLARLLIRMILGTAAPFAPDSAGRVAIPDHLRGFARLEAEAILVGQGDYFEIWTPTSWRTQASSLLDTEANAQRFAALDISRR
jgi:MraZ protein